MRILFDDLIHDAVITSLNADSSYPVTNLADRYLRRQYKSTRATDTITLTYTADKSIDCLFWGYTNLANMLVVFKDSLGAVVEVVYFEDGNVAHYYGYPDDSYYGYADGEFYGYYDRYSDHVYDPVSWHFNDTITFRTVDFIIEGPDPVTLGAIGLGLAEVMPDPLQEWAESWDDKSKVVYSEAGQSQSQYIEPMRVYDFNFDAVERARMNELRDIYKTHGRGAVIWFDPTEHNHDFITPMYAVLDEWSENSKDGKKFSFGLTIKEAR